MRFLAPSFPREVAFPFRRLVKTEKEFYELINKHNKLKNIYYSLYSCDEKHNFECTTIDKCAFDFDSENPCELIANEILPFHEKLMRDNLKHYIMYSGKKGFHVYIKVKNGDRLRYVKDALFNMHHHFKDTYSINPDLQLFGDHKRILRVPNTMHLSSNRYCIPIKIEDLHLGMQHIIDKSKKTNFEFVSYGDEAFDISKFDVQSISRKIRAEDIPEYSSGLNIINDDVAVKNFLPCVQCWLINSPTPMIEESGTWEARYQFAIYCRDIGLPKEECYRIAKKYFGAAKRTDAYGNNYFHMVKVKAIELAYSRDDLFYNCTTLYSKGLCPGRCPKYKENGSPMYR